MMHCERCGAGIDDGEEREFQGRTVCEDCYIDGLSPTRTCDPWAVYTAKSLAEKEGGALHLTDIQQEILRILDETGGIEPSVLAERLQMKPSDLEREFAALRHMEKARGEQRGGKVVLRLW